ncbi:MAG TPA: hypothetical protein VFE12_08650, partial [Acetobacteraceae bacterium]|nr:hypothetical protein [Acetobacteraceae bacterium]
NASAAVSTAAPGAFDGVDYYIAGNTAAGFVQQTVNLLTAGVSPTDIDAGAFDVYFGGYTRSAAANPADHGSISITFLNGNNQNIGSQTVQSADTSDRWSLTSGRVTLPAGTRSLLFNFIATRNTGTADSAWLDDAFVSLLPHGVVSQPGVAGNPPDLLSNPGFEQGQAGWQFNGGGGVGAPGPAAADGSTYFVAGSTSLGFARQTVDLVAAGISAASIDANALDMVFGGRTRSAAELVSDTGSFTVTMLAADGTTVLGTANVAATPTSDRWALTGSQAHLLPGTRFVTYSFDAVRHTGNSDDAYLDDAFLSVIPAGGGASQGAYPGAAPESATGAAPGGPQIDLRYPDLYTDWEDNVPHLIQWQTFNNTAHDPVKITLWQDTANGPVQLGVIAPSVADTGKFTWVPASSGISFGTHGLRIDVELVGEPGVFDRSAEAFTVPENGNNYYVNDHSATGDQFTTGLGSNRNDGKTADAPKPNPVNVLRTYSLGAGSTLFIDAGTYPLIAPMHISGSVDYGLGLDEGFTITGPANPADIALLTSAIPLNRNETLLDLDAADFMTVTNLSMSGAQRGVYAHNGTTNLNANHLIVGDMSLEGIRLESASPGDVLDHLSVSNTGLTGIYLLGSFGTL